MIVRSLALLVSIVVVGCSAAASGSDSTPASAPASAATGSDAAGLVAIGAGIFGPVRLTAEVYASGLANVAALAIDPDGRLWAATAAFDDAGTDAIALVPAPGAEPVVVVSGMHTVLGLAWVGGTLFVASKERVDAFHGFDGTTFASRSTIVTFPAGVGEVNGIAVGPDGRLVVGISAPCDACEPTLAQSGSVVSFAPDGTDLEVVATGIRAPIGLAFVAGTDQLLVTMNQRDDLGDGTPGDLLAVVEPGQDWGFPDCYGQAAAGCADVPTEVVVLDTHAAASGIAIVTGELGTSVGRAALVAEWAKGVILRVGLAAAGSDTAFDSEATVFLGGFTSPVAIISDGNGTLFVGDWGSGRIDRIVTADLPPD